VVDLDPLNGLQVRQWDRRGRETLGLHRHGA
jgi:hypothetical protein